MARGAAPESSAQARQLDQVIQAALRGKGVIDRILAFSRSGVRPSADFLAQPVVEQVLGLLAATLPDGVQIERRLLAPQGRLRGDATAWFEAVMNLCTNALQAMAGGGGVLGVSLQAETLAADRPTTHGTARAGEHLVLQVSDTGTGMAPEVLDRLFDPFFTTRGQQGTGLGLAVVHGVVEALGGAVNVHSHPGAGSRFTLYLPVAAGLAEGADPAPPVLPAEAPYGQGQTLLVVDDEAPLVALAEELLAELGYEPVGFTDPRQALAALAADPARFDLLLTDEVMPGLTGTALAAQVLALRPGLPVLLLSGYGGPQLAVRAAEAGVKQVLAKPLERSELARAVAAALPGPDDN